MGRGGLRPLFHCLNKRSKSSGPVYRAGKKKRVACRKKDWVACRKAQSVQSHSNPPMCGGVYRYLGKPACTSLQNCLVLTQSWELFCDGLWHKYFLFLVGATTKWPCGSSRRWRSRWASSSSHSCARPGACCGSGLDLAEVSTADVKSSRFGYHCVFYTAMM